MSSLPVVLIPARGGSKGIPLKNLHPVCGRPLLAWSIGAACDLKNETQGVYVTTDSEKIAQVATQWGAEAIMRPAELATDTASTEDALIHACLELEKQGKKFETVIFLQPTSPIRESEDIRAAWAQFQAEKLDSLFSAARVDDFLIWKKSDQAKFVSTNYNPEQRGRRQERPPQYLENGSIYIFKKSWLLEHRNRMGGKMGVFEMPLWKSLQIDDLADAQFVQNTLQGMLLPRLSPPRGSIPKILFFDFDGVLTDNGVWNNSAGEEWVRSSREDSLGIQRLRDAGFTLVIVTKETHPVSTARAKKLGVEIISGCDEKGLAVQAALQQKSFSVAQSIFIGNDVNDLSVVGKVGQFWIPQDAHIGVFAKADWVIPAPGGRGCIRWVADWLLRNET